MEAIGDPKALKSFHARREHSFTASLFWWEIAALTDRPCSAATMATESPAGAPPTTTRSQILRSGAGPQTVCETANHSASRLQRNQFAANPGPHRDRTRESPACAAWESTRSAATKSTGADERFPTVASDFHDRKTEPFEASAAVAALVPLVPQRLGNHFRRTIVLGQSAPARPHHVELLVTIHGCRKFSLKNKARRVSWLGHPVAAPGCCGCNFSLTGSNPIFLLLTAL